MSEYGRNASITGTLIVDGEIDLGSGDDDIYMDGDDDTLVIDASTNRVGILTHTPAYPLHVAGNMGVDEYIYHNGDTNTYIRFQNDDINVQAGGKSFIKIDEGDGIIKINNGNNNIDFRIKDDYSNVLFHADAGNSNVGIGTSSPNTSAILEMSSSNKGVMLPRVLEASKPTATSALNGLLIYEEDTHRLKVVANGEWHTIKYDE
tara:strand:- start:6472 stop:7086 length:615 start_codon:yes stop_codon:yes gene_type:complete